MKRTFDIHRFQQAWPEYKYVNVDEEKVLKFVDVDGLEKYFKEIKEVEDQKEKRQKKEVDNAICEELYKCLDIDNGTLKWEEHGALEEYDIAHYFYGPSGELEKEFDVKYDLSVQFKAKNYHLNLDINAYHGLDSGDSRVHFTPHVNVDMEQDFTTDYTVEQVKKMMKIIYNHIDQTVLQAMKEDALKPEIKNMVRCNVYECINTFFEGADEEGEDCPKDGCTMKLCDWCSDGIICCRDHDHHH